MSEQNMEPTPESLIVTMTDASNLPIYHVNAMHLRGSVDEFFFTLGVVQPPDRTELSAIKETGHVQAQPIFRFAISHDTMEKFLSLMAEQFEEQAQLLDRLRYLKQEANEEEVDANE